MNLKDKFSPSLRKSIWQFSKFGLIGAFNTGVDFGILNTLIWFTGESAGWSFTIFKSISFIVANINSYIWNKLWTFKSHQKNGTQGAVEFGKFFLVSVIGLVINVSVASVVANLVDPMFGLSGQLWANIAAGVAVGASFIWNFLGYKFLVFKK